MRYYTDALNKNIKIEIDGIDVIPRYKKDKIHNFLDRIFLIEKKMWIKISNNNIWLKCSFENSCKNIVYNHKRYNIFPFAMLEDLFQCDFNSNNCWIFIDRPLSANDNAEHLYRYIMQNHPEQNIVFVLKRDSTDWDRLKKEGFNLIDFDTEFQNIFLNSKVLIASHNYKYYGLKPDFFKNRKFIFLQHGVTQNGLYGSFNEMRADLITVATNQEYHAIAYDPKMLFNYTDKDTFLTGFARHDYLYNNKCQENLKTILIFFTWRSYLNNNIFKHDPEDMLKEKFLETAYFLKIQSLLLNEEIKQIIFELNYKIKIYFHQEVKPYLNYFEVPDYIEIAQNENIQKLFCNSSLLITDYSSVAFEMAYLKKPVIYYQFDKDDFFSTHYKYGYFNYRDNGFGPVVEKEQKLLIFLKVFLKNECRLSYKYLKRISNTFPFYDNNNCHRIYNTILNSKQN
ncbi:hypothetical protein FWA71_08505 [Campylobacter jejuni]|nr:hypothetical protein [Campylobacter jejuni]